MNELLIFMELLLITFKADALYKGSKSFNLM